MGLIVRAALLALLATGLLAVPAQAAANKTVQGQGSTSQFSCGSTGTAVSADLRVQAEKSKGTVFNGFVSVFSATVEKFGSLTSGTINQNSYTLTGPITVFLCDGVSYPSGALAQATVSGDCGTSVIIHYIDTLGERGDFLGTVVCT